MKMKIRLTVIISALALSGCITTRQELSSRIEIENFSKQRPYNKNNWFYCGTDTKNHHIITRIGGNSAIFIVPKDQIKFTRVICLPPPGTITIYQFYPDDNFQFGADKFEWYYNYKIIEDGVSRRRGQ